MMRSRGAAGKPTSGRLLIVEPNPSGHRLHFVRLIIERAAGLGREFRVALAPGVESTDEYAVHLADLQLGPLLAASSSGLSGLEALAQDSSADLVIVPDGDRIALALGAGARWRSDAQLSVLVIRATAQPAQIPVLNPIRKLVRRTLLVAASARPRVRVTTLRSSWRDPRSLTQTVGDPVSISVPPAERDRFRTARGLDPDRYWFGVLGAVDARKNADTVARAVLEQPSRSVGLLVAGKIHSSAMLELQELVPRFAQVGIELKLVDRLLTDAELDEFVVACDCLVLAHSNEGPSALFGKALLAGTRVLAAGARSLRADARAVPGHADWVPLDVISIAKGMGDARTAGRPQPRRLPGVEQFVDALI